MAACLDEYGGMVWGLAKRYLAPIGEDPEDAVQDIFVEVWQNASRFDPAKGAEASFIATIAHRRLIDRQRKAASRAKLPLTMDPGADPVPERREDAAEVDAAFEQLLDEEREALWLSLRHGLSHEHIAKALSRPLGTVKTHIRHGLSRLRMLVKEGRTKSEASHGKGERP